MDDPFNGYDPEFSRAISGEKWRYPKSLTRFPFVTDGWFQNYVDHQMIEDGDMNEEQEYSD